ncbi:MAG: pentapeptide repeat-containing protein [Candidatus Margulisiibacteriota bacterium]
MHKTLTFVDSVNGPRQLRMARINPVILRNDCVIRIPVHEDNSEIGLSAKTFGLLETREIIAKKGAVYSLNTEYLSRFLKEDGIDAKMDESGFASRKRTLEDRMEAFIGRMTKNLTSEYGMLSESKYGNQHDSVIDAVMCLINRDIKGWNDIKNGILDPHEISVDLSGMHLFRVLSVPRPLRRTVYAACIFLTAAAAISEHNLLPIMIPIDIVIVLTLLLNKHRINFPVFSVKNNASFWWPFIEVNFQNIIANKTTFSHINFYNCEFNGAQLNNVTFLRCGINRSDLAAATLINTTFTDCRKIPTSH